MFIPIEAMFSLVIENQKNLFEEAWRKHIVIVSPANLLAILRTIESLWKIEKQNQNAQEIAKEGAFLYDKFVGLLSNLKHLNTSLEGAMKHYADALTKIEGKEGLVQKLKNLKI